MVVKLMGNVIKFLLCTLVFTLVMHERISSGEGMNMFYVILGVSSMLGSLYFAKEAMEKL